MFVKTEYKNAKFLLITNLSLLKGEISESSDLLTNPELIPTLLLKREGLIGICSFNFIILTTYYNERFIGRFNKIKLTPILHRRDEGVGKTSA